MLFKCVPILSNVLFCLIFRRYGAQRVKKEKSAKNIVTDLGHSAEMTNALESNLISNDEQPISMVSKEKEVSINLSLEQPIPMVKRVAHSQASRSERMVSLAQGNHGMHTIYPYLSRPVARNPFLS